MAPFRRTRCRRGTGHRLIESYLLPTSTRSSSTPASINKTAAAEDATLLFCRQQSIESYFHRTSSQPTPSDNGWDSDDDKLPLSVLMSRCSQPLTLSQSSSSPSPSSSISRVSPPSSAVRPPQKMTAAMRQQRDRRSSQPISIDSLWDGDEDLPLSVLRSQPTPQCIVTVTVPFASSPTVIRRTITDATKRVKAGGVEPIRSRSRTYWNDDRKREKRRKFYQSIRARLAHPDSDTMCAYCGEREHSALHHEDDFKRVGTNVSSSYPHTRSYISCA